LACPSTADSRCYVSGDSVPAAVDDSRENGRPGGNLPRIV